MLKKAVLIILLILLIAAHTAVSAEELRQFQLKDGTVLNGKIVSAKNGKITISTDSLGNITVNDKDIVNISLKNSAKNNSTAKTNNTNANYNNKLDALKNQILTDDNIMNLINDLRKDPQVQDVLNDPEIVNAVNAGDWASLMKNPKFIALLNNQTIQKINKSLNQGNE
ncbi:hypothetical protein MCHI_002698 [Candidatus Magnetoovum chiemensis]|nr:hypothetical protein MCHI_002698 [Candidatus Magnetoovum chiemensis]